MAIFPSSALAAFGKDKPNLRLQTLVKEPEIQKQLDFGIQRSADTQRLAEESIKGFMDTFRANQPRIQEFTQADVGRIGDIYSGRLETQLGGLRNTQRQARVGATEAALRRARGAETSRAAASGMPGGSSYRNLMESRIMNDIMTQAAMEDANLQRGDFNLLQQLQLGNLGVRQNMLQGLEERETVPLRATSTMRGIPMQNLAQLQQMDEQNKFRNIYRKRGAMERFADMDQANLQQLGQVIGMAKDVMGMVGGPGGMGGGAPGGGGGGGGGGGPQKYGASAFPTTMPLNPSQGYYNPTPIPSYNPSYPPMRTPGMQGIYDIQQGWAY